MICIENTAGSHHVEFAIAVSVETLGSKESLGAVCRADCEQVARSHLHSSTFCQERVGIFDGTGITMFGR